MTYFVFKANGSQYSLSSEKPLTLEQMMKLVGGWIEFVCGPTEETTLCVNEEGLLKKLPKNKEFPGLVGDVVMGRLDEGKFVGVLR